MQLRLPVAHRYLLRYWITNLSKCQLYSFHLYLLQGSWYLGILFCKFHHFLCQNFLHTIYASLIYLISGIVVFFVEISTLVIIWLFVVLVVVWFLVTIILITHIVVHVLVIVVVSWITTLIVVVIEIVVLLWLSLLHHTILIVLVLIAGIELLLFWIMLEASIHWLVHVVDHLWVHWSISWCCCLRIWLKWARSWVKWWYACIWSERCGSCT